jgi:addiction module HigA family antidote
MLKLLIIIERKTTMSPIHPGRHLAEFIEEVNLSPAKLAVALHVPRNRITRILRGECAVSVDMALRLGRFFHQTPQFWLNLQIQYETALTEQTGLRQKIHNDITPMGMVLA